MESRFRGTLLGGVCGDILGAPMEGMTGGQVREEHGRVKDFCRGYHMGVPRSLGPRFGMYTDDTNATLATAVSLLKTEGRVDPDDILQTMAKFWDDKPLRAVPGSTVNVFQKVLKENAKASDVSRINFPDGSYANGGAMRITPVALAFFGLEDEALHQAVEQSLLGTHVHPEGVDAAWIQCKAVTWLLGVSTPDKFVGQSFVEILFQSARTDAMRQKLSILRSHHGKPTFPTIFFGLGKPLQGPWAKHQPEMDFQIEGTVAVACALWAFLGNPTNLEEGLADAISLGGDTDTIASLCGFFYGALLGEAAFPQRWVDQMENGKRGKDFILETASRLFNLSQNRPT